MLGEEGVLFWGVLIWAPVVAGGQAHVRIAVAKLFVLAREGSLFHVILNAVEAVGKVVEFVHKVHG